MNKLCISFLFFIFLTACTDSKTADEHIAKAKQLNNNNKQTESVFELKNALQKDNKNFEARFLLGEVYFNLGDFVSADKEFEIAYGLNGNNNKLNLLYAKTLYLNESFEDALLALSNIVSGPLMPEVMYYQYLSYYALGETEEALSILSDALNHQYDQPYDLIFNAIEQLKNSQDIKAVYAYIQSSYPEFSNNFEYLQIYGKLAIFLQDYDSAAEVFTKQVELFPQYHQTKLFLIDALIKSKDYDSANIYTDKMLRMFPSNGYFNLYKAIIVYAAKDCQVAKAFADKAILAGVSNVTSREIAGFCAFKLGDIEQSYTHVKVLNEYLPNDEKVVRLLSMIQLKLGYTTEAVDNLSNLTPSDTSLPLFIEAGIQSIKKGNHSDAKAMVEKSSTSSPVNLKDQVRLGLLEYTLSEDTSVLEELKDSNSDIANAALASAYLNSKNYKEALVLAKKWMAESDDVAALNLAGYSASKLNDNNQATQYFSDALKKDNSNAMALNYLANQALISGEYELAQRYFSDLVNLNPDFYNGYKAYYAGYKQMGLEKTAFAKIKESYLESKKIELKYIYAAILKDQKKYTEIHELLQAERIAENTPSIHWSILSFSYSELNDSTQAIKVAKEWTNIRPLQLESWLNLSSLYEKYNLNNDGLLALEKAYKYHPYNIKLQVAEVNFMLKANQLNNIEAKLAVLEKAIPSTPSFNRLKAEFFITQKKYKQAADYYQKYHNLINTTKSALMVYQSYQLSNDHSAAADFLFAYAEQQPAQKINLLMVIGNDSVNNNTNNAIRAYRDILTEQPDHIIALNNLAWIYKELKNYSQAEKYALQANQASNNNPNVLDTLAMIYFSKGDLKLAQKYSLAAFNQSNGEIKSIVLNIMSIFEKVSDNADKQNLITTIRNGALSQDEDVIKGLNKLSSL